MAFADPSPCREMQAFAATNKCIMSMHGLFTLFFYLHHGKKYIITSVFIEKIHYEEKILQRSEEQ